MVLVLLVCLFVGLSARLLSNKRICIYLLQRNNPFNFREVRVICPNYPPDRWVCSLESDRLIRLVFVCFLLSTFKCINHPVKDKIIQIKLFDTLQ